ncbi:MAG: hypothetical protein J6O41_03260, partial [Clostridia bacterium]|nr:hypothetical protein [Clostridia bacterium]
SIFINVASKSLTSLFFPIFIFDPSFINGLSIFRIIFLFIPAFNINTYAIKFITNPKTTSQM